MFSLVIVTVLVELLGRCVRVSYIQKLVEPATHGQIGCWIVDCLSGDEVVQSFLELVDRLSFDHDGELVPVACSAIVEKVVPLSTA